MLKDTNLGLATDKKITELIEASYTNFDLAFSNGVLIGFMLGVVHETIFNNIIRASDIGVYVTPPHRGNKIADALVKRFETWAISRGAKQIWLGQTTNHKIENTKSFYERLGYTVVGVNSVKEV
jgi:GNAT superfamily N-acetyltransferase